MLMPTQERLMKSLLLLVLAVTSIFVIIFDQQFQQFQQKKLQAKLAIINTKPPKNLDDISIKQQFAENQLTTFTDITTKPNVSQFSYRPEFKPEAMYSLLLKQQPALHAHIIYKILTTLKCVKKYNLHHNEILTVIDYSKPSNEKRLWVFDLKNKQLLFHTYVSHGLKSGYLNTQYFSNKFNSKASSIGIYTTEKSYYGRDGLSLRLSGHEHGFNDNALNRAVVMHGGWYAEEAFIKKYGRPGRSWGCPTIPLTLTHPIISTIKDNSLFVIYYPSDAWFIKSKFLNCDNFSAVATDIKLNNDINISNSETRDSVFFAALRGKYLEVPPVLVIAADNYKKLFPSIPLERMLRRQINHVEYVALNEPELREFINFKHEHPEQLSWDDIVFVLPDIKQIRGYYITQMKIVSLGKILNIKTNNITNTSAVLTSPAIGNGQQMYNNYIVEFESRSPINLKTTNQFIRWIGL